MKHLYRLLFVAALAVVPVTLWAQEEPVPHGEAAPAEANEGHGAVHHAPSMFSDEAEPGKASPRTSLIFAVINFAIMAGLLVYLLRKPIRDFLTGRRDDVRKAIEEAQAAQVKAEKQLAEYRQMMAGIDTELRQLKDEILSAGQREREQILADAKAQAEKAAADARLMGDQEVRRAKEELRDEMVRLATELTAKSLAAAATPAERAKQMQEFVAKLESLS